MTFTYYFSEPWLEVSKAPRKRKRYPKAPRSRAIEERERGPQLRPKRAIDLTGDALGDKR